MRLIRQLVIQRNDLLRHVLHIFAVCDIVITVENYLANVILCAHYGFMIPRDLSLFKPFFLVDLLLILAKGHLLNSSTGLNISNDCIYAGSKVTNQVAHYKD